MKILTFINPLRKSHEGVTKDLLKLTPIGMDIKEVEKVIKNKKEWEIMYISYEQGFVHPYRYHLADDYVVGEKSIRVFFGRYNFLFIPMSVSAFWGFDEEGKLIEIYVVKNMNIL
jgi:hypothetical protein